MKPYIYNIALAFLALMILVIPFFGPVYLKQRNIRWYRRFTGRGRLLIVIFLLTIYVGYKKDLQSDTDDTVKQAAANRLRERDKKENQAFILKQQERSITQISKSRDSVIFALANSYNLLLDSTKREIYRSSKGSQLLIEKMIKDSTLRQSRYYSNARPTLDASRIIITSKSVDSLTAQLKIDGSNATAFDVKIEVAVGYLYNNIPFKFENVRNQVTNGDQMIPTAMRTIEFKLPYRKGDYIFYVKGTYKDIPALNLTYPLEKVLILNTETKKSSTISSDYKSRILGYVKFWMK